MKDKNLLIIFTRNPELGQCKTRLAAHIGDQAALNIYNFLLNHTSEITKQLEVTKEVHYAKGIIESDIWSKKDFQKKQQLQVANLGARMEQAFAEGFANGYQNIVIIGSDMLDLAQQDIEHAFSKLLTHDCVLGPADDGGYYLFGMKTLHPKNF